MKKILAIMLIAVIAVAGVFAYTAPTNTSVKLNYVVNGVYQPAYKLHYDGNGSDTNPSDTAAGYFDGTTAIVVSNSNQVTLSAKGGIAAGTAKFSLYDFSYVKSAVSNKLTLTVALPTNAHWLKSSTTDYSNSLCKIGVVALDHTTEQADDGTNTGDDDTTQATIYSAPGSGKGVVVTYDAEETINRAGTGVKIASFDVTWNADKEADPATYETTLTVSVQTE